MTTPTDLSPEHAETYPPPPPETPAERKGRLAAIFVMAFLIVTMMYATYMGTMHDPHPRGLQVAVVGTGAQADRLAADLESSTDGGVEARVVDTPAQARDLVTDREIAGAIRVPGSDGNADIYQASAAGPSQASVVTEILGAEAEASGWTPRPVDVTPLAEGDGAGTMVLFAAMGFVLAGYVPLSGMLAGTPNLLRFRRFLPIALGWGLLTSSVTWLILGPIGGAVDGHFPLFLGVGTLTTVAVGVSQLLLTKFLGPFAVLLGMLFWVVLGVPSSGLSLSIDTMPGFFQWMHGVLPLPAAGETLRAVVYFDGEGARRHVLTLVLWLVIPALLVVLRDARSRGPIIGGPAYTDPDAPLSALAGGPVAPYRKRLAAVALFPFAIMVTVVTLMGLAMHEPELEGLPVAVVAPQAEAEAFVDAVEPGLGEVADLRVIDSADQAEDLIRDQDIAAAYVLAEAPGGAPTLLTASGTGASQETAAIGVFEPIAAQSGTPLVVEDVAPLTDDDSAGSNSLYAAMAWVMAGFLLLAAMRGGAPDLTRTRQLLPMITGWSVGISVWLWFLFDVLIGAINTAPLAFIACGALTVFAVAWTSAVLTRVFGLAAIVPLIIVVMLAGVPASGGGLSLYMVSDIFRSLNPVLPLPAAVDIARSLVYLDGTGVGGNLLVIAIWGAAALAINVLVVDPWVNRAGAKPHAPLGPKHMPATREKKPKHAATDVPEEVGATL